ncbi:hypothetical protein [Achromobacter anxifer]|uniref:hypothetical protein n=1 Tax=Achromobacter anxifer TaxID=1287737 RepID=UPI0023F72224|nr:hypothetical protein [Achromobacter anxifer]MDF8364707.1 hypothetical protein [Achromobacter anxifer]
MFARKATVEDSARQYRASIVHELIRTIGRLPTTSLNAAYQTVLAEEAAVAYPEMVQHCANWSGSVPIACLANAPVLASRLDEVRHWLVGYPEHLFSLVVGLAQDKGEDHAWAMAYG